jgi:mRNA-degrading endonuclease RelE of RelBE toxin-antitoxin system
MKFIESSVFTKYIGKYLSAEEYSKLRRFLSEKPEAGDIIQGTGGFRKVRWIDSRRNKGKRGGTRIIYYYFLNNHEILFFTTYNKNETKDLSSQAKKAMKQFINEEKKLRKSL